MIRKRANGYEVIVDLGRDANGRRRQRSRMAPNLRAAKRLEGALIAERDDGRRADGDTAPLRHLHARWLERVPEESTRYQAERSFARYVDPTLGAVPIGKLRAEHLDGLYLAMTKGSKGQRPLAAGTVRKVHTNLRAALELAVRWGWIATNPALRASPPEDATPEPSAPSVSVMRALLAKATETDAELVAFLWVGAATGKRRGELCALRRGDLDLARGEARIVRAIGVGRSEAYVKQTKTRTARTLALGARTVAVLQAHLDAQDATAAALETTMAADAYVFCADVEGHEGWHPHAVTRRYRKLRRLVPEAKGVELRQLRHFMVTQGLEVATVAAVSGRADHARPSTTVDKYRAFLPPADAELADALDRVLGGE